MQLTSIKPRSYTLVFKLGSDTIEAIISDEGCWELSFPDLKGKLLIRDFAIVCKTIFALDDLKDIPSIKIPLKNRTAMMIYRDDDVVERIISQTIIDL